MTFFADLTPHTYTLNSEETVVLNVGWLGRGNEFTIGETSDEFRKLLKQLCDNPIGLHRGFHICHLCNTNSRAKWARIGNGQIRIQDDDGIWYVAPTMIYHYVTKHDYLPPKQFIDAVLAPQKVATKIPDRKNRNC